MTLTGTPQIDVSYVWSPGLSTTNDWNITTKKVKKN